MRGASALSGTLISSASPFASSLSTLTGSKELRGIDSGNVYWAIDATGFYASSDGGSTWTTSKGFPPNTTAGANVGKVIHFGTNIYTCAKDEVADRWKIYRATRSTDNTVLTWTAVHTMTAGATGTIGVNFNRSPFGAATSYLYLGDYGDPTGGPSIYRSIDGTTWTTEYTNASIRHIHAVTEDPYNPGHVWSTVGDGNTTATILKSTDYGDNWSVAIASFAWQGVQISFSPDWVFVAGDNDRGTLIVIDRATSTPYMATPNFHYHHPVPGGAAEARYYRNAFYGIVDPNTGVYYCVANDTSSDGDTTGLFYVPKVGARVELLEDISGAGGEMFLVANSLIFGKHRRASTFRLQMASS